MLEEKWQPLHATTRNSKCKRPTSTEVLQNTRKCAVPTQSDSTLGSFLNRVDGATGLSSPPWLQGSFEGQVIWLDLRSRPGGTLGQGLPAVWQHLSICGAPTRYVTSYRRQGPGYLATWPPGHLATYLGT